MQTSRWLTRPLPQKVIQFLFDIRLVCLPVSLSLLVEPKQPADAPPAMTNEMRQLFSWATRSSQAASSSWFPFELSTPNTLFVIFILFIVYRSVSFFDSCNPSLSYHVSQACFFLSWRLSFFFVFMWLCRSRPSLPHLLHSIFSLFLQVALLRVFISLCFSQVFFLLGIFSYVWPTHARNISWLLFYVHVIVYYEFLRNSTVL